MKTTLIGSSETLNFPLIARDVIVNVPHKASLTPMDIGQFAFEIAGRFLVLVQSNLQPDSCRYLRSLDVFPCFGTRKLAFLDTSAFGEEGMKTCEINVL
jgi:hypothetical protein